MSRDLIANEYYDWLSNIVCENRFSKSTSFNKLLIRLHDTEFKYTILFDENRADAGINLRWRFALDMCDVLGYSANSIDDTLNALLGPCSVLEMMIALAIHCEEHIMDDPTIGNRCSQWFWNMVVNLGLGSMSDDRFDRCYVDSVITRFLNRKYEPDGRGGLFTVKDCDLDLRKTEIFVQMCRYLGSIT